MIVNGQALLKAAPIADMVDHKVREHGVSWGLGEAGYDIRIKQSVSFDPVNRTATLGGVVQYDTLFTLASSVERFTMPTHLVGIVHDKSTWIRQGLAVQNTVVEPGWGLQGECYLTLELTYHGNKPLMVPAGAGIAQVIFHQLAEPADYGLGKYATQGNHPVPAIMEPSSGSMPARGAEGGE